MLLAWVLVAASAVSAALAEDKEDSAFWLQKARDELTERLSQPIIATTAKNVILFIGDGMGPNTVTAAGIYVGGEGHKLSFEKLPFTGMLKTYAVDRMVPDSACTATALFTGVKTNYDTTGTNINVKLNDCNASLVEDNRPTSILKWAQDAGKATGFVTTTRVTHATPSALYSHSSNRNWECEAKMLPSAVSCKDIARQLVEDDPGVNLNVIMGGGRQCMQSNVTGSDADPIDTWSCYSSDGRDLIAKWQQMKAQNSQRYKFVSDTGSLKDFQKNVNEVDHVLGIFANGHMMLDYARDTSDHGMPSIEQMTSAAIALLSKNSSGFVLVVEGGMIDQAHHRGHARQALGETVAFAEAIQAALNATSKEETLIIVTADHDHGLTFAGYAARHADILGVAQDSNSDGVPYTTLMYATGDQYNYQFSSVNDTVVRKDPSTSSTTDFTYSQQTGVLTDEVAHGGSDVAVYAIGPMAHLLTGVHEQNYVAHLIAYAAQIGEFQKNSADTTRFGPCVTLAVIFATSIYFLSDRY